MFSCLYWQCEAKNFSPFSSEGKIKVLQIHAPVFIVQVTHDPAFSFYLFIHVTGSPQFVSINWTVFSWGLSFVQILKVAFGDVSRYFNISWSAIIVVILSEHFYFKKKMKYNSYTLLLTRVFICMITLSS